MQQMLNGYRGLSLLVWLNSDRFLSVGMVLLGLLAGSFLGEAVLLK